MGCDNVVAIAYFACMKWVCSKGTASDTSKSVHLSQKWINYIQTMAKYYI